MINSVVSSPRLSGILHRPIEVGGLSSEEADKVLTSRTKIFSKTDGESYLPIWRSHFPVLYNILNFNLRSVLQEADEYCLLVFASDHPETDEKIDDPGYLHWLREEGLKPA